MQDKTTIEGYQDVSEGQQISKNNSTWFEIQRIDPPEGGGPFGDHSGEAELECVEATLGDEVGTYDEGDVITIDAVELRSANGWDYVREGE